MTNQYSVNLISNDPSTLNDIKNSVAPENLTFFDGTGIDSFSKLVNSCVASSNTEIVIILSDKVRPTAEHIKKMVSLLEQGYAFVGFYRFACFGIKKELFRQIGFFDERYAGGGFEDYDFVVRLIEHNLSFHVDESVPYITGPSKWLKNGVYPGYKHWCSKWLHRWAGDSKKLPSQIERTMPEENYPYQLGPAVPTVFLYGQEKSFTTNYVHVAAFWDMDIMSTNKLRFNRIDSIKQPGV